MKRGYADLPLHSGECPLWLFQRMKRLGRGIIEGIVEEWGSEEALNRLADPFWFQSLGCLLGFDWHSSGLTTTLCAALKEGIRGMERDLGLWIAGGKGKTSLKTPEEIERIGDKEGMDVYPLIYASRMSAKVDNCALQDGYQLYHHVFVFTKSKWCVIQQGMNPATRLARRYHWLSDTFTDFVCEPHSFIVSFRREENVLNMVAKASEKARETSAWLAGERPEKVIKEWEKARNLYLPLHHYVVPMRKETFYKVLLKTYERKPRNFEELLGLQGVGPTTIRALALLSEVITGAKPSYEDPVKYSFAHGGKDGHPYPVNLKTYDTSIRVLEEAIRLAKWGKKEKWEALKKVAQFYR